MDIPSVSEAAFASVALSAKFAIPTVAGVPLIWPEELNVKPGGNVPLAIVQVYGGLPPIACRPWLYATPTSPLGREMVLI